MKESQQRLCFKLCKAQLKSTRDVTIFLITDSSIFDSTVMHLLNLKNIIEGQINDYISDVKIKISCLLFLHLQAH